MSSFSVKEYIINETYFYMNIHGLIDQGWSIEINNSKSTLGLCDHDNRIITISQKNYYIDGELRDTILHEIAHAIAGFENKHNKIWKNIAQHIGCNQKPC